MNEIKALTVLTRVITTLARGHCGGHFFFEQKRCRGVIVVLGRQPLVGFVVNGRVVTVLGLVVHLIAADYCVATVQRRRSHCLRYVQMFHVDRLLFGRAQGGLLELKQSDLLPSPFQRQHYGHASHQKHGHSERTGYQTHVRLRVVAGARTCKIARER